MVRIHRPIALTGATALLAIPLAAAATGSAAATDGGRTSVIVVERTPASDAAERAVRAAGGSVGRALPLSGGFAADLPSSMQARLAAHPAVRTVTANAAVTMSDTSYDLQKYDALPPDTAWPTSTGLTAVPAGVDGRGVTVAVLDTGLTRNADLGDRVVARVDMAPDGTGYDQYGHGSHMTGLVAGDGTASGGRWKGAAPGANIVSVKVAGWNGATDVSQVLAGLEWVAAHKEQYGIRVVSLSFGTDSSQKTSYDPLNHAVQRLWRSGVLVVVAAGNRGDGGSKIDKPGDDPYVVTVGAADTKMTEATGDDEVAPFSSRGPTADGIAKPDLLAPGISLVSHRAPDSTLDAMRPLARQGETYFRGSGSSQATALVAGTAALMLQAAPTLTPDETKAALVGTTSRDLAGQSGAGSGLVHAGRAVQAAKLGAFRAAPANMNLTPASGTGSIDASRGSNKVYAEWKEVGKPEQLSGEVDALGAPWLASEWVARPWTATNWHTSLRAPLTRVTPGWDPYVAPSTVSVDLTADNSWTARNWHARNWHARNWHSVAWDEPSWSARNWHDAGLTTGTWTARNWHAGVWG